MSFDIRGSIISSLLRGIPSIVWYGFQSSIGGTAMNKIVKILSNGGLDNVFVCFVILQFIQIILSLYEFHSIKWVEIFISLTILSSLMYTYIVLMSNHQTIIIEK